MANKYWVGGSGNWNETIHWSTTSGGVGGVAIPTLSDNVYFNVNSFTSTGQIVTININANCLSMDWTGAANNPTLEGNGGYLAIYGSLVFINAMICTFSNNIYMQATTSISITTNGLNLSSIALFSCNSTGTYILQDNLNIGLVQLSCGIGTFNSNSKTITCGIFNSGSANSRTLTLGSSTINCTNVAINASLPTMTANTAVWNITGNNINFNGMGIYYYDLRFNGGIITVINSNSFTNMSIMAGCTVKLTAGTTQTGSHFYSYGRVDNMAVLQSTTAGTRANIVTTYNGSLNCINMRDISFNVTYYAYYSFNSGNNNNVTFFNDGKYLFQDGETIKTYIDSTWQTVGTTLVTQTMFSLGGLTSLSTITKTVISQLTNPKLLISQASLPVSVVITATPSPKLILSTIDTDLNNPVMINNINSITLVNTLSGAGVIRVIVSPDSGVTWKTYFNGEWIMVDITDLPAIKANGIMPGNLALINNNVWNALISSTMKLRFGYYLEQGINTDIAKIERIVAILDMNGYWIKIPTTDYFYQYNHANNLQVNLKSEGTYKITTADNFSGPDSEYLEKLEKKDDGLINLVLTNNDNQINLAKTNFKLDSYTGATKNAMKNLVIDCFNDVTGINPESTSIYDSVNKSMGAGILISNQDLLSSPPESFMLFTDEILSAGLIYYQVSLDNGLSWIDIIPNIKTAIPSAFTGTELILKATINNAQLNAWAYSWA